MSNVESRLACRRAGPGLQWRKSTKGGSCEVGVRVTPLVDGRSAIPDVVEVGMTGIEAVKLGDHREFWSPTSRGRIAGYRIRNDQSAGLESRSSKNGDAGGAL